MEYTEAVKKLSSALKMTEEEIVEVVHAVVWKMPCSPNPPQLTDKGKMQEAVRKGFNTIYEDK